MTITIDKTVALSTTALSCTYDTGGTPIHALRSVDLTIRRGSFTAIMGPSGSGKTTLMHCAAGLQKPTSGSVHLGDSEVTALDEKSLARLRRVAIGFVFQSFNLLPALTVIENVELPVRLEGIRPDRAATERLLARVGLGERTSHRPPQLSGGQQQRVAIARALIAEPAVVFADEPTGALDLRSAREVLTLLRELADAGQTIIMVTHDPAAAAYSDEVLFLADGRIVDRLPDPTSRDVAVRMSALLDQAERANATGVAL
ncbi:ABC transporter ATP-binding protein [Glaciibacter superstes]|uniref:ABC transporter ATP-binding protein n=1 Tax=Glaciibacter superstes TaxID=501023 RepID=UPI0003B3AC31|nr:ABC transporter ATP-binding protein [Glaciibacter superstes]